MERVFLPGFQQIVTAVKDAGAYCFKHCCGNINDILDDMVKTGIDVIHPLDHSAEYMPYPDVLGFLSFLNTAKLNITPVREFVMIDFPSKGRLGINICFESLLPIISKTFRNNGAEAIFVFTDDAGFKDSLASWQHVIFSRVRAIENGCYEIGRASCRERV